MPTKNTITVATARNMVEAQTRTILYRLTSQLKKYSKDLATHKVDSTAFAERLVDIESTVKAIREYNETLYDFNKCVLVNYRDGYSTVIARGTIEHCVNVYNALDEEYMATALLSFESKTQYEYKTYSHK